MSLCPREREVLGCLSVMSVSGWGAYTGQGPAAPTAPQLAESSRKKGKHTSLWGGVDREALVLETCTFRAQAPRIFCSEGPCGWSLGQEEGDSCGVGDSSWRNSMQKAFRPGGGGTSSQEPCSSWVFTSLESMGRRRFGVVSTHGGSSGRKVAGRENGKYHEDRKAPLLTMGWERWR